MVEVDKSGSTHFFEQAADVNRGFGTPRVLRSLTGSLSHMTDCGVVVAHHVLVYSCLAIVNVARIAQVVGERAGASRGVVLRTNV